MAKTLNTMTTPTVGLFATWCWKKSIAATAQSPLTHSLLQRGHTCCGVLSKVVKTRKFNKKSQGNNKKGRGPCFIACHLKTLMRKLEAGLVRVQRFPTKWKEKYVQNKHFKYIVVHLGIVRIRLHCVAIMRLLIVNRCLSCALQEKLTVVLKPRTPTVVFSSYITLCIILFLLKNWLSLRSIWKRK